MAGVSQVYLLGRKPCVERCLGALFWRETNSRVCTDVWTSFKGTKFRSDEDVRMQKLKNYDSDTGSDMECQDLDLCDSSGSSNTDGGKKNKRDVPLPTTPRMKRLKPSFNSCHGATGGHESDIVQPDETDVLGDIHAIEIDDESGLNRKIVPFIFQFFLWPCLIVLAIHNESSVDLYGNFLKELGFFAQLRREHISKVLVVYVPSQDAVSCKTKIIDSIQCRVFDNYFGESFYTCQIEELVNKVPKLLQDIGKQAQATICGRKSQHDNGSMLENKLKQLKPEDVVNKFLEVLRNIIKVDFKCAFSVFLRSIPETELRKVFTVAFEDYGLIDIDDDDCYILPFILSETLQSCDMKEKKLEIYDAVRLTVKCETIPASLKVEILMTIKKEQWTIKSHGPNNFESDDSYLFVLKGHGIVIEFRAKACEKLTYIYIYLLKFDEQCTCQVESDREHFEKLRKNIEAALKSIGDKLSSNKDLMCIIKRHIQTDKNTWITEGLMSFDQFYPWFTSKEQDAEERNRELSDQFLIDISELFGSKSKLFFISLGIEHDKADRIINENRTTLCAVYELLREWRKLKGQRASIAKLRSKIKETSLLTVDINRFDDIVKKHGRN